MPIASPIELVKDDTSFIGTNIKSEDILDIEQSERAITVPKKRSKCRDDLPEPNAFGEFEKHKRALNNMDSKSFEKYVSEVSQFYTFSSSENNDLKTIRARIKNREAARKSRLKRKNKVGELESNVTKLLLRKNALDKVFFLLLCLFLATYHDKE